MSAPPAPVPTRDPQLAEQLDALLQHNYQSSTSDSSGATATSSSTPTDPLPIQTTPTESTIQPTPPTATTTTTNNTEPLTSRTTPLASLPPTTHLSPVLAAIAATGRLCGYSWPAVRELLIIRTRLMLDEYVRSTGLPAVSPSDPSDSYEPRVTHLLLLLSLFTAPPFTLQRLTELLSQPSHHYHTTSHYLAALCKCVYGITADSDDDGEGEGEDGEEGEGEDEGMDVAEMEAAGVQVTSAMDYVSKELPIVTVMPNVLSVEQQAEENGSSSMETSE